MSVSTVHDHVALIEQGIQIRWLVDSDSRDLAAGELRPSGLGAAKEERGCRRQGLEEGASVHAGEDTTVFSRQSTVVSRSSVVLVVCRSVVVSSVVGRPVFFRPLL